MSMRLQKLLATVLAVVMLVGLLPVNTLGASELDVKPVYKVKIVSYIRGDVTDLRCSELLEARIYKSVDGEQTWTAVTEVQGVSVSKLAYTWTNTSANTPMVVYLSHNMAEVGLYGDTAEGTFKNGISSTAVGAQWAAYKTPGYDGFNFGFGGNYGPGGSSSQNFSGTATVRVTLPDGTVIQDSRDDFGKPSLSADLNTIALGLFVGESTTFLDLLAESGLVHVNCDFCSVSNIRITDNDGVIQYDTRTGTVYGHQEGEGAVSMTVSKRQCTVHNGQTATVSTKVFVFKKPTTSTTTTTLTLHRDTVDHQRCKYYINGVEGTKQADGSVVFTGLDPDTQYTVDVVATYSATSGGTTIDRYAYAYVSDTTKPLHTATVNTYLNGVRKDVEDIHGEDVVLYIKTENGGYISLTDSGTGVYTAGVENGIYHVYHLENGQYHRINDNPLIISNASASVDVHHYSVTYDAAGGSFAQGEAPVAENYASGKPVAAILNVPTREGYVFTGWGYGGKVYRPGAVVTGGITGAMVLEAQWERKVNVFVNVTIDHTYKDALGNTYTDVNGLTKDDVLINLVAKEGSSAYLEVDGCSLSLSENSHSGHNLFADGVQVDSYGNLSADQVKVTLYQDGQAATFTGLSGAKDYYVTVEKAGYDATVTARRDPETGDWIIDVSLKFNPQSHELEFEVNMDSSVPEELYPKAAIVKILYFDEATNTWKLITQHSNGNPGVRVEILNQTGNKGSYPVWSFEPETDTPYGYRILVSAFVYADGTIVPTEELQLNALYTDKNYSAVISVTNGGDYGTYDGAFFRGDVQEGTLKATISLKAYNVLFDAMGGTVNGNATQNVQDQYYIPAFDGYQPVMKDHTFLGWWYQDANGNYTQQATADTLLTGDVTLYAMWSRNLTGSLMLEGTYMLNGQQVSVWPSDRANEAIVVLQEITSDTVNTIDYRFVTIRWNGDIGESDEYSFTNLHPLKQYRISVLLVNYTTEYQNSTTALGSYNAQDYLAVYQQTDLWNTFVNGKLSFEPESYYQPVDVDASQLGETFRPEEVLTQIWYTERNTGNAYNYISQHTAGGLLVKLTGAGKVDGTFGENVWKQNFNGNLYDYILKIVDEDVLNMPITILYGASSNFETVLETAKNTLTATLVPNKYTITYDLNTGNEEDVYVDYDAHTWSFDTEIVYAPTRTGYVFKGWSADAGVYENGKIKAGVAEDVTLTAIWEKADYAYTIEYYYDDVLKHSDQQSAKFMDVINTNFDESVVYQSQNYALDQVVGRPLVIGTDASANVIKVYYATDKLSAEDDNTNKPDTIPDKYQAVVTFSIENGTWDNADAAKPRVYTLYGKDADGVWTKLPSVAFEAAPTGTANAGFENDGKWSPLLPETVERSGSYTLSFNDVLNYTVTVVVENGTGNVTGQNETFTTKTLTVAYGESLSLNFAPAVGYALDYIEVDGVVTMADGVQLVDWDSCNLENITKDRQIRVVYATDVVGDRNDAEQSDNVPDKYQKKVIFKVVNGTWNGTAAGDIVTYVTLLTDGKWDVNGSAVVDTQMVPVGMIPDTGFIGGEWDKTFPETVTDTNDVTYQFTFAADENANPDTGDDSSLLLWFTLMFVSAGCLVCICLDQRKRH